MRTTTRNPKQNVEPQGEVHPSRRFAVALSFPGEHRRYVADVANALAGTLTRERILYDKYHEAEFSCLDLDVYLPRLYREEADLVVIFLCPDFQKKRWCQLEWRSIRQLIATTDAHRIMLLSFGSPGDLSDIGILPGDGYANIEDRTPDDIAQLIHKRVEHCSRAGTENTRKEPTPSPELNDKIEHARKARRRHELPKARQLWEEIGQLAEESGDCKTSIRARLEIAYLQLKDDLDPDEAMKTCEDCLNRLKKIDLGNQRARVLQLLGEAHRFKGNLDQARGFLTSARDAARSIRDKGDEGWSLLALSALEGGSGQYLDTQSGLELIQQAYDCFSALYASGDEKEQRAAREGFATCHSWRAELFGHVRLDDALAEHARALELFRKMGSDFEWNVAEVLYQRGDLHARADDPQLAAKDIFAAGKLFQSLGDHLMYAKCCVVIGEMLDRLGGRSQSKQYFEAATAVTSLHNDGKHAAWIWFRYACKLMELREYEQAKSICMTLLDADWLHSGQRLDIVKNLCLAARAAGQEQEMEQYSQAALEIIDEQITETTSANERRRLILSRGHLLADLDDHNHAIACFRRGIESFEAVNDRKGIIEGWSCIAQLMGKMKKRKEEREAYEKVLTLIGDEEDSCYLPMTLTMLAQLDIFEQQFDQARNRLDRAELINERLRNPAVTLIAHDLRSKLPSA